jgi:hypothetical protein
MSTTTKSTTKKKSKQSKTTSIIAIIDKSGSMGYLTDSTIGGFNSFLSEQQETPGLADLTLVLFNESTQFLYTNQDIQLVAPLTKRTYLASGNTALYDAIGSAVMTYNGAAEKVVVLVITDGYENASRIYHLSGIQNLIRDKRAQGWEFIFMGANVEKQYAYNLGFDQGSTFTYYPTMDSVDAVYGAASRGMSMTRSGMTQTVSENINDAEFKV